MRKRTAKAEMNLQLWMEPIQRCRNSELTITAFCEQEGIHLKSHYYWLNKIRKLAIEELPESFEGVKFSVSQRG